jgi:uncharacterized protein (TIGR02265 family)
LQISATNFVDPPWEAPLDVAGVLRTIPEQATIAGMFLEPLAEAARQQGLPLPSARERYVAFRFYPMREHAYLLIETCVRLYPNLPVRRALRKLGRGAPRALIASTIGKVVLGSAIGPAEIIRAIAQAYPLHVRPAKVNVLEMGNGRAVLRLEEILYFLDSHHVGVFEGVLSFAGRSGRIKMCAYSATAADLLCTWE